MRSAQEIASALKATSIDDAQLQQAGVDTEGAQVAMVELTQKFGNHIPDATIRRELVGRYFHPSAMESLAVLVFRGWEAQARDLLNADAEAAAKAAEKDKKAAEKDKK